MKQPEPRGLNRRRVQQLLSKIRAEPSCAQRVAILARSFIGCGYIQNPLIGSADIAEVFTVAFDRFDCVTYIETVLALAVARDPDDFGDRLRRIRYARGRIQWQSRNHYMTQWIRNNIRDGLVEPVSVPDEAMLTRERILNVVSGLAAERSRIRCFPKSAAPRLESSLHSGDLIFFVSTRKHLDVFHAGILARNGGTVLMCHASRSQGAVVEQKLDDFLKANRMAGVIIARPREAMRRTPTGA